MAKYVLFFQVTSAAVAQFIQRPEDRRAPVSRLVEAIGGRLEAYYWMFGEYDGLTIFDAPDSASAAALVLAANATGAFRAIQTHELIEPQNLVGILERAKQVSPSYRPPGST